MARQQRSLSVLYGPTGSATLQNRFAVEGDPRPSIPIIAAGGLVSNSPAHQIGVSGSAYRYGSTVVGSAMNLIPINETMVSPPPFNLASLSSFNLGSGVGTNSPYNVAAHSYNFRYIAPSGGPKLMVDGELIGNGTIDGYEFLTASGTVDVTNGSTTVVGTGTSFTTQTLVFAYGYTPAANKIMPGDLIQINHGGPIGSYRVMQVTDDTHLEVFPPIAEATASGLAFDMLRTGYNSMSNVVLAYDASDNPYYYYAGLFEDPAADHFILGSIQCQAPNSSPTHYMGPVTICANDIAFYKSYMIYGGINSIGWSVPGFPTAFPFGATDFPADAVSVITTGDDYFCSFERLGDQLIAIFRNSIWLVQQVPGQITAASFTFYKLPEVRGALNPALFEGTAFPPTIGGRFRPSCSADGAVYYQSVEGIEEFGGTTASPISTDVNDILQTYANLHWDAVLDAVVVELPGTTTLIYFRKTQEWVTFVALPGFGTGIPDLTPGNQSVSRRLSWARYDAANVLFRYMESDTTISPVDRPTVNPTDSWTWASPLINVSDVYKDYSFGGLRIDAEGPGDSTASLSWTFYSGSNPYNVFVRNSGTYDYAKGTPSARYLINDKIDDAWIGITLSGSPNIKLVGVSAYTTETKSAR